MACKLFIENFVDKVIEKSSHCHSCENRRRTCKKFTNEYNHLTDEVLDDIINSDYYATTETWKNVVLTFLHNCAGKKAPYTKESVREFVAFMERNSSPYITEPLDWHPECCADALPSYLVVVTTFNYSYVYLFDNVYDYYENRPTYDPETYYVFKTLYFRKWLDDLLSPRP